MRALLAAAVVALLALAPSARALDQAQRFEYVHKAASVAPFLDATGFTGFFAYSTRKLRAAYAGKSLNACLVSSPTTCTDIGFDANGNFNTAAAVTFGCTGNACEVATFYDQSTNAFNVTQATAANRPLLVLSDQNGRACLRFNGTSQFLENNGGFTQTFTNLTSFIVGTAFAASGYLSALTIGTDKSWIQGWSTLDLGAGPIWGSGNGSNGTTGGFFPVTGSFTLGTFHQVSSWAIGSTTTNGIAMDGTTGTTGTGGNASISNANRVAMGAGYNNGAGIDSWAQVDVCEEIIVAADESAASPQASARANQKAYWGTP